MAAADGAEELSEEWRDVPDDPPRVDVDDDVIATETEGIVHLRPRARIPRASGEGSLAPTRAWLSAPSTVWEPGEPTGGAARER